MTAPRPHDLTVAALYVDPKGPYSAMAGVDAWDASRDATLYDGPCPVVAHPPCGPWGKLSHMCTRQDPALAVRAVEQVREWGGVLEHPRYSKLWSRCRMPRPGELPDAFGGWTLEVRQCDWGHPCAKPTWLYVVGGFDVPSRPPPGIPVAAVTNSDRPYLRHRRRATAEECRLTPPAFAAWLVALASRSAP